MNGREQISIILNHRSERPFRNIARNFFYGLLASVVLLIIDYTFSQSSGNNIIGYLLCGWSIMYFEWGSEHLWFTTIAAMIEKPFGWLAYLTRIPFWWIAGGMGYTIGLLFSKKLGLFNINEIPIILFFIFGGNLGIIIQVFLQFRVYRILKIN
ncbi:MAG: hypothetical protein QME52_07635 [Bacteroidota bacterium]|nr:hypothetical protein [Bacteroidota bacterium]